MIATLLRVRWHELRRDRTALLLTFALPIVFFSIFAVIFGGMGGGGGGDDGGPRAVGVLLVDEDDTAISRVFGRTLAAQDGLDVERLAAGDLTEAEAADARTPAEAARARVRRGTVPVAVILPAGFGRDFGDFGAAFDDDPDTGVEVELVYDAANPIARFTVAGLMQAAAFQAAPDALLDRGIEALETFGGTLTPAQRAAVELAKSQFGSSADSAADRDTDTTASTPAAGFQGLVPVRAVAAQQATATDPDAESPALRTVGYYAAGIGVMFLLFSCAGAAGLLIEEEERGTLERMLAAGAGMPVILGANWLFLLLVGVVQLTVMFAWARFVFGLPLAGPAVFVGLAVMIPATAAACAAFGILLATLCRSRAQMSGLSTIVILVMSALGGSMVPRFAMPAFMETTARFTVNGWALDGFLAVLWYREPDAGVADMLGTLLFGTPAATVLLVMTAVLLAASRLLARRWERV
jgi:ABC-2 type transport system permease protein